MEGLPPELLAALAGQQGAPAPADPAMGGMPMHPNEATEPPGLDGLPPELLAALAGQMGGQPGMDPAMAGQPGMAPGMAPAGAPFASMDPQMIMQLLGQLKAAQDADHQQLAAGQQGAFDQALQALGLVQPQDPMAGFGEGGLPPVPTEG